MTLFQLHTINYGTVFEVKLNRLKFILLDLLDNINFMFTKNKLS